MVWPLVFLAAGGAAFAVRGALRFVSRARLGASQGAFGGAPPAVPEWVKGLNHMAGGLKHQFLALTRDMKGFEAPMTKAEAYQILSLG